MNDVFVKFLMDEELKNEKHYMTSRDSEEKVHIIREIFSLYLSLQWILVSLLR